MVAKTAAQRVAAQRKRRKRKGLKRREYYLTDAEHEYLQECLKTLRAPFNQTGDDRASR